MAKEVRLPQLGQTMEEGTIVDCLVKVGDQVSKGDVIFEIVTRPVDDVSDFEAARRYYQERTKPIALGIRRGEVTSYISVDPLED